MKPLIIFILFTFIFATINSFGQEISVVDVKRNITLSDGDNVYRDYYINAGDGSALRKNMVVTVKRKINIRDAGTKAVGDFDAVVGQLKVIQVGNKVSVAREFKLLPRDEAPMLDQVGIMTGDKVDLANSYIDNSKPNYKHKTSEVETPKEEKTAGTNAIAPATEKVVVSPAPTPLERVPAVAPVVAPSIVPASQPAAPAKAPATAEGVKAVPVPTL